MSAAPARTTVAPAAPGAALEGLRLRQKPRSLWSDAWRQFRRHKLAMAGTVVITLLVAMTLLGPFLWRTPIDTIDFAASKAAPSLAHPVGTNDLGQDLLARIIWGGRISLSVGVAATLVAVTVGVVVGALAGFFGKAADSILMRVTDLFLALPTLPLLLLGGLPLPGHDAGGVRADPRGVFDHRAGDRGAGVDADGAAGAGGVFERQGEGVRRGGAGDGGEFGVDHGQAHPAERAVAGDRVGEFGGGGGDHRGVDA